ncbi:hypothetical protein KAZ82_00645 [Candidatus Babeliales bacterium]|nr:hypothetical protein [Candidatus Babeliales bacterium]
MLASISGRLVSIQDTKLVIEQAGIGFEMLCPTASQFSLNQSVSVHTYLHWSAELGPSLYGFAEAIQKDLFLLLIDCQGVGPKLAITILQQMQEEQLLQIIVQENVVELSQIKGLGTKKSEIICMHLKDKAPKLLLKYPGLNAAQLGVWHDLHEALISLNYSVAQVKHATAVVKDLTKNEQVPFDLLLRKALVVISKKY